MMKLWNTAVFLRVTKYFIQWKSQQLLPGVNTNETLQYSEITNTFVYISYHWCVFWMLEGFILHFLVFGFLSPRILVTFVLLSHFFFFVLEGSLENLQASLRGSWSCCLLMLLEKQCAKNTVVLLSYKWLEREGIYYFAFYKIIGLNIGRKKYLFL